MTRDDQVIPRIIRSAFLNWFKMNWAQGEHVSIVGMTGSGKTTVAETLLTDRRPVVVVATKAFDRSIARYVKTEHFKVVKSWPPANGLDKVILWNRPQTLDDFGVMRESIYDLLNDLYIVGGWTIYLDDIQFVSDTLQLRDTLRMFYTQVRSNGVSIVASLQRPFWVPLEAMSQNTYAIVFTTHDLNDLKRIAQTLSVSLKDLTAAVRQLKKYEFVFVEIGQPPIIVE